MVPGINLGFNTTQRSGDRAVHHDELPRRVDRTADRRARSSTRMLTGRVDVGRRPGRARSEHQPVRAVRPAPPRGRHQRLLRCSPRTPGASTPTVTLTGGLRWDLQTPFTPRNDIDVDRDAGRSSAACPASATAAPFDKCNFFSPGATRRRGARSSSSSRRARTATRPTGTTSRRTSAWRGGRTCRAASCARSSAIPSRRRCAAATRCLRAAGHGDVHRHLRRQPGQHAQPDPQRRQRQPGAAGRDVAGAAQPDQTGCITAPFPATPTYPDRRSSRTAQTASTRSRPTSKIASARTWTVSFQRSITRDMAVDIRYVGTRGVEPVVDAELQRRATSSQNGFFDEFKLAMANLRANNASGGTPRGHLRLLRRRHRHEPAADLPGLPERPPGRRQPGGLHRRPNLDEHDVHAATGVRATRARSTRPATSTATRRAAHERDRRGPAGELLRRQPGRRRRQRDRQRRVQRLPRAADRAAPPAVEGPARPTSTTSTRSKAARRSTASATAATMNPTANVRHAIKTQWDWTIPVGRGQRFGTQHEPDPRRHPRRLGVQRRRPHPGAHGRTSATSGWSA